MFYCPLLATLLSLGLILLRFFRARGERGREGWGCWGKGGGGGGGGGGRGGCVCVFTATSSPAVNGFQVNRFPFLPDSPAFSPVCCLISSSLYQQSIIQGLVFLSVAWFFSPMLTYAYGKSHFLYLPASLIFPRWNFQFFSPIYAPRPQLSPFRQWHL